MFRRPFPAMLLALVAFVSPASAQWQATPGWTQAQWMPAGPPPTAVPPGLGSPQGGPAASEPRHPAAPNEYVQPLDRILPSIRSSRPGQFFDAEGPFSDGVGGWHYRIKWMTPQGRIVWLDTDARTGRVLGPYRGYAGGMVMPPAGLRYFPIAPGPRGGMRGRFGGWRPGGFRPGGRPR